MKEQIKQEMLEAIYLAQCKELGWLTNDDLAEACASIAEKHIEIARLEERLAITKDFIEIHRETASYLEKQLEKLKEG